MSQQERQRYHVLKTVLDGQITLKKAGQTMGVNYRHADRLKKRLAAVAPDSVLSPIPESYTILLFATSLISLAGFRKKFKK